MSVFRCFSLSTVEGIRETPFYSGMYVEIGPPFLRVAIHLERDLDRNVVVTVQDQTCDASVQLYCNAGTRNLRFGFVDSLSTIELSCVVGGAIAGISLATWNRQNETMAVAFLNLGVEITQEQAKQFLRTILLTSAWLPENVSENLESKIFGSPVPPGI